MLEDLKLIHPGEVRVRIAPSPTGTLHIGTVRTALFNYLFSQKYKGTFILRIEDTDVERSKKEYEEEIIEGLKWLGIEWQEGPDLGGSSGYYRQSERKEIYKKYLEKLLKEGKIYYCFCSQEELEAHRNYLMSIGEAPRYSEKCRELSEKEIKKNLKEKKPFVLRFKTPKKKVVFTDIVRGEIEYDTDTFGDMVIAKDFETALYNFTCVIDDYEMNISHVIRGEDHIPNTPKQILIAEALGIEIPKYIHLPLIFGTDKTKLSKRHGAKSVLNYREEGYLPEAIVNFLAFLGWNPGNDKEIFSLYSLVQEFSLQGVQKSAAVFNPQKLIWLNSFYIRQKSKEKLTELCLPYLVRAGLVEPEKANVKEIEQIVGLYQERLKYLSEIPELIDFFFKKDLAYSKELLKWKEMDEKEIKNSLEKTKKTLEKIKENNWTKESLEKTLMELAINTGTGDRGRVLWPLRAALTGKQASASPFDIALVLGKEKTLERINQALKKI